MTFLLPSKAIVDRADSVSHVPLLTFRLLPERFPCIRPAIRIHLLGSIAVEVALMEISVGLNSARMVVMHNIFRNLVCHDQLRHPPWMKNYLYDFG